MSPGQSNSSLDNLQLDDLVVGTHNQIALGAARRVIEESPAPFNPLLVYGNEGVGKTAVLVAVANSLKKHGAKDDDVVLMNAAQLTRKLTLAIETDQDASFRKPLMNCRWLLIDDIHLLTEWPDIQTEFQHILNRRLDKSRPVILASRSSPQDMHDTPTALTSRLSAGLSARMRAPGVTQRARILQNWLERRGEGVQMTIDAIERLAHEKALTLHEMRHLFEKLMMLAAPTGKPVNVGQVDSAIKTQPNNGKKVTAELIERSVSQHFKISLRALRSASRKRHIAKPRQICMYLLRKLMKLSYEAIGDLYGGRDHTTVIYACRRIEELAGNDARMLTTVRELESQITNTISTGKT